MIDKRKNSFLNKSFRRIITLMFLTNKKKCSIIIKLISIHSQCKYIFILIKTKIKYNKKMTYK